MNARTRKFKWLRWFLSPVVVFLAIAGLGYVKEWRAEQARRERDEEVAKAQRETAAELQARVDLIRVGDRVEKVWLLLPEARRSRHQPNEEVEVYGCEAGGIHVFSITIERLRGGLFCPIFTLPGPDIEPVILNRRLYCRIILAPAPDYRYDYHMSATNHMTRTSMALDAATLRAMKHLSEKWHISKAEVIRRAVRQLSEKAEQDDRTPSPLEALDWLQQGGGLVAEEAASFRAEVQANREARTYWWQA